MIIHALMSITLENWINSDDPTGKCDYESSYIKEKESSWALTLEYYRQWKIFTLLWRFYTVIVMVILIELILKFSFVIMIYYPGCGETRLTHPRSTAFSCQVEILRSKFDPDKKDTEFIYQTFVTLLGSLVLIGNYSKLAQFTQIIYNFYYL